MKVVCVSNENLNTANGKTAKKQGLVVGKSYDVISNCKSEDGINECYLIKGLGKVRVERFAEAITGNIVDIPFRQLVKQSRVERNKKKQEKEMSIDGDTEKKYTAQFRIVTAKKIVTRK